MTRFFLLYVILVISMLSCNDVKNDSRSNTNITWSEHIAPIIYKNCTPCHRPGEAGPFNLLSYADAVKKAALIRFVTKTKYMPPWPADNTYSHFLGEKVLTEEQIKLINTWVDKQCPRGDSLKEPPAPKFYKGSFYGKPDLVIKLREAVKVKGNGNDAFLILKLPYQLAKDTIMNVAEFVPGQRKLIHHVNGHLVSYDSTRKFNYQSGLSIYSDHKTSMMNIYNAMHIPYTDNQEPKFPTLTPNTVYYLPGYVPPIYPKEIGGYRLKKNGLFILNNIHYGPSNKDLLDSSYINVFFRKTPIKRPIREAQLGTFGLSKIEPDFSIPPNEIKTFQTHYTLPNSISLLSVNPHMHLIGKTFLAFAINTNGDTIPLIKINKWDFRWQYYYTYKNPLKLEKGCTIYVYGTFDNTNKNPKVMVWKV
jgi:Copper type II ascorbate-dependent monooxygenase, C-terminal domain